MGRRPKPPPLTAAQLAERRARQIVADLASELRYQVNLTKVLAQLSGDELDFLRGVTVYAKQARERSAALAEAEE